MNNAKLTIGRIDRPHLTVESTDDQCLKVAVIKPTFGDEVVLVGYAFIGASDDGYSINRVESWAGSKNKVGIKDVVIRCLSVNKFNLLLGA